MYNVYVSDAKILRRILNEYCDFFLRFLTSKRKKTWLKLKIWQSTVLGQIDKLCWKNDHPEDFKGKSYSMYFQEHGWKVFLWYLFIDGFHQVFDIEWYWEYLTWIFIEHFLANFYQTKKWILLNILRSNWYISIKVLRKKDIGNIKLRNVPWHFLSSFIPIPWLPTENDFCSNVSKSYWWISIRFWL